MSLTRIDKDTFRARAKNMRDRLNSIDILSAICDKIKQLREYRIASDVMMFYPLNSEISLLPLFDSEDCEYGNIEKNIEIESKNTTNDSLVVISDKRFYLPRVIGEDIVPCPFDKNDILRSGAFNVMEPTTIAVDKTVLNIAFIPALAVDARFNRLGYGKGFYDRFLRNFDGLRVVPIADDLIFDDIPHDELDERVDIIVSEKRILRR